MGATPLPAFLQATALFQALGGFSRPALLVAQHDDMRRARLPLTSLQQHFLTLAASSNYARLRSSELRDAAFESLSVCLNHESHVRIAASVINRTNSRIHFRERKPRPRGGRLGGQAPALIRSASPPPGRSRPSPQSPKIEPRCREAP